MQRDQNTQVSLSVIVSLLVLVSSSISFGQTTNLPAPVIPSANADSGKSFKAKNCLQSIEQPFAELLQDAIVDTRPTVAELILGSEHSCALNAPCNGQCPNECVCSLEADEISASETQETIEEEDEWDELMACPCTVHDCDKSEHLSPNAAPPVNRPQDYCRELASLLGPTLESKKLTSAEKRQSIEAAMKMVAEKALESADSRIAEMEIAHRREIQQLQNEVASKQALSLIHI